MELYMEQRSLDQYDAIDFFDFCEFSSSQRQNATHQWKFIILPLVAKTDAIRHSQLLASWKESKSTIKQYWDKKEKEEEHDAQIDDHIDHIRNDTIEQTQLVSKSITRGVGKRLQGTFFAHQSPPTGPKDETAAKTPDSRASIPSTLTPCQIQPSLKALSQAYLLVHHLYERRERIAQARRRNINGEKDIKLPSLLPSMKPIHAQLFQHAVNSMQKHLAQAPPY
ncbi:hypothetical protein BGW38_003089 [Lunasporangiospora selenospora]|uniref:Uncharacterized protein n=1 Tax=Lunasporangiospora selenospora TaxID=979761 RepID=A0A9P6KCX9_9FUNG|nr:hypothetical protein BGW38_003089 [Lunasporangiospora selenospora]